MIGIYKITNTITNSMYVGKSVNIEERIKQHWRVSKNKNAPDYNTAIHRAMRKYGEESFQVEVLEECSEEKLDAREIFWIHRLNTYKCGYNETLGGEGHRVESENHPRHKVTKRDVEIIRERYNNKERKKEVYKDYQSQLSESGFHKIWNGYTWTKVKMDVYTPENIQFHRNDTANAGESNGRAKLKAEDILKIREDSKYKSCKEIYNNYKGIVSYKYMQNIIYKQTWKVV